VLASELSTALSESEEAFVATLMSAIKNAGFVHAARSAGTYRESLHRYARGAQKPRFAVIIALLEQLNLELLVRPKIPQIPDKQPKSG
jgi:DNA-binding phage protein